MLGLRTLVGTASRSTAFKELPTSLLCLDESSVDENRPWIKTKWTKTGLDENSIGRKQNWTKTGLDEKRLDENWAHRFKYANAASALNS